jgi:large subunit ribosomal protein L25
VGKGSARALRREGKIPAVIYGDKQPPLAIAIDTRETFRKLHAGGFLTHIATIKLGGETIRVLPRDYQLDSVSDALNHVDFIRVSDTTKVKVEVPVHFHNQEASPGIGRGGALNIVAHTIELLVLANAIPEHLDVDLTGTDIGDAIHVSQIKLPEGATPVEHDDFVLCSIAGMIAEIEEETAAPAEGTEAATPDAAAPDAAAPKAAAPKA